MDKVEVGEACGKNIVSHLANRDYIYSLIIPCNAVGETFLLIVLGSRVD